MESLAFKSFKIFQDHQKISSRLRLNGWFPAESTISSLNTHSTEQSLRAKKFGARRRTWGGSLAMGRKRPCRRRGGWRVAGPWITSWMALVFVLVLVLAVAVAAAAAAAVAVVIVVGQLW